MKISSAVFLSHQIHSRIPVYAAGVPVTLKKVKSIKNGDSCNTMSWSFSNHSGTHLEMPRHFCDEGACVSQLRAKDLVFTDIGLVRLNNVGAGHKIKGRDLKGVLDCQLLLIKTGFERYRKDPVYWQDSPFLDISAVKALRKNCPSLKAVGIDVISVSNLKNRQLGRQVHKALLVEEHIMLIEDMRLSGLKKAPACVIALPLLVKGADASPCTVIALAN